MTAALNQFWMDHDISRSTPAECSDTALRRLDDFLRGIERRALRIAELSTGHREDALDIVQDSMLAFVRHYGARADTEWLPLFHRVLDNRILDHHRRNQVRQRWTGFVDRLLGRDGEERDALAEIPDPTGREPWKQLADEQTAADLERALRQLPNRQRQAFLLRVWEGLDVADTAHAMSCSEGSVKTHLFRAMNTLRSQLEAHHE